MRETQASICAWADETFGQAPSAFRVTARANEEMAELLRAVSSGQPAEKIIVEAADVAIVLCRVAKLIGPDPLYPVSLGPPGEFPAEVCFVAANAALADLIGRLLGGPAPRAALDDVIRHLAFGVAALGGNLCDAIDEKMAINRAREWRLDGTGHGYHVRDRATQDAA